MVSDGEGDGSGEGDGLGEGDGSGVGGGLGEGDGLGAGDGLGSGEVIGVSTEEASASGASQGICVIRSAAGKVMRTIRRQPRRLQTAIRPSKVSWSARGLQRNPIARDRPPPIPLSRRVSTWSNQRRPVREPDMVESRPDPRGTARKRNPSEQHAQVGRADRWRRRLLHAVLRAGEGNRTPDLLLTMEALYRLSYSGGRGDDSNGLPSGRGTMMR